ncbi:MAG: Nif11-like leader peptide family natural product precursor [Acidiferrobacteraceae bacterium]|jgi:predicted ribosomally synthesized peptide with nif11-like leader|nr:Nif11-like leader peptide family natural product precursor [Acidiferrobacteraceae bacterium]MBT5444652.1 Nif11-like leader peptide family natural product precursor [Gammaproteobacteria bacterium]MBT3639789.1 Nif11-like leader peptide family natural product precursor [Acidiferrobacteraceae bacterium]MBT3771113.1 Nif11-like leader peptide family natural product precursor [Acidiferrobacteraceae bacterium]MBT4394116.1 Nif11-like leader peptide family natural product precursor [Acidiferrobacterac
MSKENLEQFINKIAENSQLQSQLGEETDTDTLIALGAENGYEFSLEDFQESTELSDEELDGVAGGRGSISSNRISQAISKQSWMPLLKQSGNKLSFTTVDQMPINESASGNSNNMMPQSAPGCSFG